MSEIKAAPPIPGNSASMTRERREWMRAVLSNEEAHVPGVGWHEWLGSALLALDAAEARALEPGAPVWRDGPPPRTEPGKPVYMWREGRPSPVSVMYSEGGRGRPPGMVWLPPTNRETGRYEPWEDARWAPIPRPDHNPKS